MTRSQSWEYEVAVEADISVSLAWHYMTDPANWIDPPAEFRFEGPFIDGSHGTTWIGHRLVTSWMIRDVHAGSAYSIDCRVPLRAVSFSVRWQFAPVSDKKTRLTQRITLRADHPGTDFDDIRDAFEAHLEPGMQRLAERMASERQAGQRHVLEHSAAVRRDTATLLDALGPSNTASSAAT